MEINQSLLSMKERKNRLIYQPILSKQDKSVKYTTQYCPRPTKPVEIPTIFVYDRQNRLIYQPILSMTEKKLGDIPTISVHNGQNRVIYQPVLFITYNIGRYTNQYCPRHFCSWHTNQGYITTNIVHDRQNRGIYQPILSMTDKTG